MAKVKAPEGWKPVSEGNTQRDGFRAAAVVLVAVAVIVIGGIAWLFTSG